jgi:enoyl reductase-like protein
LIAAELNAARGSTPSTAVQQAIAAANAGLVTTLAGGHIQLSTSLSQTDMSSLVSTLDDFNSSNDCG